jgi:Ca2+-binding RTX toxin-like protein
MTRALPQLDRLECRRLLSAGDPDWSFGDHGSVKVSGKHPFRFADPGIVALAGGDMLLAGSPIIRKVDALGAIDFTFGRFAPDDPKGYLVPPGILDEHDEYEVRDLDAMADGRFVVVTNGTISRFHADGSADTSFGVNGARFVADLAAPLADVHRAAVRPDGRIIVEGSTAAGLFTITALTADGDTDPAFAPFTYRKNSSPAHPGALLVQDGDKVLLAADGDWDGRTFKMIRFDGDGTFDATFADDGIYPIGVEIDSITAIHDVAIDGEGRIVTLELLADGAMGVRRLLSGGLADTTFGGGAADAEHWTRVNFDIAHGPPRMKMDGNGRILIHDDYRLARLTDQGLFDPTFGQVTTAGRIFIDGFLPLDDGSIYVGSQVDEGPLVSNNRLYRLSADDTPAATATDGSGTLSVVGTDDADRIVVYTPFSRDIVALVLQKAVERRETFGRAFDPADVSLVSIRAGGGDDLIWMALPDAVAKPATVSAGDGNDQIIGSAAADSLSGNAGNDRIDGRGGPDRLDGNGGRDKLRGQEGNDRLFGGDHGDWLNGGEGEDILFGHLGDDYLDGGPGPDRAMGSDGNDVFVSSDGTFDDLYGGGGSDRVDDRDEEDLLTDIETT